MLTTEGELENKRRNAIGPMFLFQRVDKLISQSLQEVLVGRKCAVQA